MKADIAFKLRIASLRVRYLTELVSRYEAIVELPFPDIFFDGSLEEIEKAVIEARINRTNGNKTLAAQSLGISKSTLHKKVAQWRVNE